MDIYLVRIMLRDIWCAPLLYTVYTAPVLFGQLFDIM